MMALAKPGSGDLVISEIMAQSAGIDSVCEWFEITNLSDDSLLLDGVTLFDLGRNEVALGDHTVAPHC